MDTIWEMLSEPWCACLEEAWAAYRAGSIPIGAAVTDPEGRLLSRGRNRIYEKSAPVPLLYGHRLAHAEMNALVALEPLQGSRVACVLYTTTEPCPLCTGAVRQYGVQEVRYASRDPVAGSTQLLSATPHMRRRQIRVVGPEYQDLEAIVIALHTEFSLRFQGMDPDWWVLEAWAAVVPQGVRLGRYLAASGELACLYNTGAPTPDVINHLAGLVGEGSG